LFGFGAGWGFISVESMTDSRKLIEAYARDGSEAAFRELVARYINLVYSTALRLVDGDRHLAEDVTQMVFISLARLARGLSSEVMLGGWLHQRAFHLATKAMRRERRRQTREREAVEMSLLQDNSEAHLRQLAPILDEAVTRLGRADRTAILLRFFEQRDFRAVGQALGSNEDAARMRVNRALGKLQTLLKHRGVALTVPALGSLLAAQAVTAAPAGLALTTCSAALASTAGSAGAFTFLKIMIATKLKTTIAALAIVSAAGMLVIEHQRASKTGTENDLLRREIARLSADADSLSNRLAQARRARSPRLPAPPVQLTPGEAGLAVEPLPGTNLLALSTNTPAELKLAQLEGYLKANGRNAASLLAAFRTTGDPALLQEAMQKFPNDAHVDFEAALKKGTPPAEQRQWLDNLKRSAPENALGDYLSALNYLKAGQTDLAVQDLLAASGKQSFQDYTLDRIQDDEEAYRAAGYSQAEATVVATSHLLFPQLVQMRDLTHSLIDLANSYRQAGDEGSRQSALQMAVSLGQRYSGGGPGENLISQLVGVAIERQALGAMDPNSPYGADGAMTVQQRLDQLVAQRTAVRELVNQTKPFWDAMSEQDWISYHSRSMVFGEMAAQQWLLNKYGQK
jgi:RNA polymerase sigma factor (sigma-70 family)